MKLNLLGFAGGLGLAVSALIWPSVSQAQGFCYLVNAEGRVVNLDDLCAIGDEAEALPAPDSSGASATPQGSSSASETRRYTITGPAVAPSPNATPSQPSVDPAEPASPEPAAEPSAEPSSEAAPAEPSDATEPNDRLDIPVREIETPEIPQIQTPQTPGSADSGTDAP